ncbi:hypothetical protein [Streptomyces sp. CC208A]|uniref:hypothetical protein n=1 Tax=Streptomyces sp. CC208A TaxID=3044573 RepID=UPI0024A9BA20|nr:hypothetical protein [Streptomyces sp. CC208A]
MTDSPDIPAPQHQGAQLQDATERLRDVMAHAPGRHIVTRDLSARVKVLSDRGEILGIPRTDADDEGSLGAVRKVLAAAGITAEVERRTDPFSPGVVTTLVRAEDVERLMHLVLDQMPRLTVLVRELVRLLSAHSFLYADQVDASGGQVWDLRLTLDDVRKVCIALGEPDEELHTHGIALYGLADRFAQLLKSRLGGKPVQVTAYPSRGALCNTCHEEILEVGPLTPEQTELLTNALARTLRETP